MPIAPLRTAGSCAVLVALLACASDSPAPLQRESLREVEATVVQVQKDERLVSLRGPEGETFTVEAGPEVRNFDQVQVGDKVVASYYEAVGFAVKEPGAVSPSGTAITAGRAEPGEKPGAAIGQYARTTVTIESVDRKSHTVTFKGEDGMTRAIPVRTEEGRAFVKKLKPGDRVEITYAEAVAVRVDPGR
jgi:Cu/Ag efflux protein CusF